MEPDDSTRVTSAELGLLRDLLEARIDSGAETLAKQEAAFVRALEEIKSLMDAKFVTHETMLDAQSERAALALAAQDKAIAKSEAAYERRFEGVNEFRGQLNDQAHTFLSRTEHHAMHASLVDKIDELRKRADLSAGKGQGLQAGWGYLVAVVGLIVVVVNVGVAMFTK